MSGNDIASDALRIKLAIDIENETESLAKLQRINSFADTLNAKASRAKDDLNMQRMAIEGKYDPNIQQDFELIKANKLIKEFNLSLHAQSSMLTEISDKHYDATIGQAKELALEKELAAAVLERQRLTVAGKFNPDIQRDLELAKAAEEAKRLNTDLTTQDAIVAQIIAKHHAATVGIQEQADAAKVLLDIENARAKLTIEAKFSPDAQRTLDIEKLTEATKQYGLSLEYQKSAMEDIEARHKRSSDTDIKEKERAAAAILKIEQDSMDARVKLTTRYAEINDQKSRGIITSAGRNTLMAAAAADYDATVANLAAKAKKEQEARDRKHEADRKAADRTTKEYAAELARQTALMEAEDRRRQQVEKQAAAVTASQLAVTARVRAAGLAQSAALTAELERVMNGLATAEMHAERTTEILRLGMERGDITTEQYTQSIAELERRTAMMAGGAGRAGMVMGNVLTGAEDFITVMSMSGAGMDGFAAATRSASNNVGQAVRSMGTAAAAVLAPLVSIGMVLAGFAIPAIYKWVTGADDAAKATNKWKRELEAALIVAGEAGRIKLSELQQEDKIRDIKGMEDPNAIQSQYNDLDQKRKELIAEMQKTMAESKATATALFDKMVPMSTVSDFNDFVDRIGVEFGGDVEAGFRQRFKDIQTDFITNAITRDAESARVELERQMLAMQKDMDNLRPGSSGGLIDRFNGFGAMNDGYSGVANDFVNVLGDLNDAAVIDQIQALEGKIEELSRTDSEAARMKKEELQQTVDLMKELHDQYSKALDIQAAKEAEIRAEQTHQDQQHMENELELMQIQSKRNTMLGEENQAERRIFDLALKRKEIMESGIAAPDTLAGMFNAELEAEAAQLEKQIAAADQRIAVLTGEATQAGAFTSANAMMLAASSKKDDNKENVELLKAIRDHLAGINTLNVEIQ